MPTYEHECNSCNGEFEDIYSIKADPPTLCPLCGVDGQVKRVISGDIAGRVLLSGTDLTNQMKKDRNKMKQKIKTDENVRANLIGESKYQEHVVNSERIEDRYKKQI